MIVATELDLGEDDPVYDQHGQPSGRIGRTCRIGVASDHSAEEALNLVTTLMQRLIEGREAWVRYEPTVDSDRDVLRQRTIYRAQARFGYLVPETPGTILKVERAPMFTQYLSLEKRDAVNDGEAGP